MSTSPSPPNPASKRQKTSSSPSPPYELIYWPTIPGRGEYIRLALEATRTPYTDTANLPSGPGAAAVLALINPSNPSATANPPPMAPPILRHGELLISQTSDILMYLGPRVGLAGADDDEGSLYRINQLALTALDAFCDEAHETHHPVSTGAYYEDQADEAVKRAADYRNARLPKFLAYFERVLRVQEERWDGKGEGGWLYGKGMTWADLVLWQGLDGVGFAFPRRMERLREGGEFGRVFALCERVRGVESVGRYLASERRMRYGNGIWRFYPELDGE